MPEVAIIAGTEEDQMAKTKIDNNAFVYPMPMTIVGTMVDGKPNYLAVAWVNRVNYQPPMLAVALGKVHHTNKGISLHGEFSVNIPGQDLIKETDYCGLVSGAKTDKSSLFATFPGELKNAPLIEACPLAMQCRVVKTVDLPQDTLFIGEIVAVYSEERFLTDGKPDPAKMRPFSLTMPDNRYWSLGEPLAKAWDVGQGFKRS